MNLVDNRRLQSLAKEAREKDLRLVFEIFKYWDDRQYIAGEVRKENY